MGDRGYDSEYEKRVANLYVELVKFMGEQTEREINIWQAALAKMMLKLAHWDATPTKTREE